MAAAAAVAVVVAVTAGGWLNPGLFARSKWRSAVILKFSRWQGARIGLKNQSGSLFLVITASRSESGNCWCRCFLSIPPLCHSSVLSLSLCFLHPRTESVFRLFSWLAAHRVSLPRLLFLLHTPPPSSRSLLVPYQVILPIYLSYSRYLRYHHRHQPSLSPSSTALNIRQLYV